MKFMKKIYVLCLILSLFTAKVQALHLTLSNETGSVGTQVVVKLTANDFNIIATQFSINFNPSVLQYVSTSITNPAALGYKVGINNIALGQIGCLWIDPALVGLSLANGTELMRVTFTIIGGGGTTSSLSITDTPTPYKGLDGRLAYTRATSSAGGVVIPAVLPIDLQSFTAKWRNPMATDLVWQTASETNAAKFAIEQGTNGTTFQTIGEVKAKGSSTTPQYYSFTHDNPTDPINYYRLKMVDTDAQFKYSKTLAVNAETKGLIAVQKRGNQLVINGLEANSEVDISVTDMMGRVVFSSKKPTNTEGVLTATMPYLMSGMYVFTVQSKQNLQFTKFLWTNDN
jgi:Cohesin domain